MATAQEMLQWRGHKMVGSSGDKIGKIEEIYLDQETDTPEWALVNTGMFGSSSSFVPLAQADQRDSDVVVPYDKAQVKDAPRLEADGELSQEEEAQLYRHYGLEYESGDSGEREQHRGGRGVVGHDVSGPETDEAMTRSEEEVHVGTQSRESGRARLRKHIVTEQVTQTVPVSREEVRVTREPITRDNLDMAQGGPELSEEEHEVTLHEEVPVVDKQVRPVERVRMDTEKVTGEQQVSEEVRKEQIEEVDNADAKRRP